MAERKLQGVVLDDYAIKLGLQYKADVINAVRQGWFRVPALRTAPDLKDAIEDIHWQRFRGQRLKGTDTATKLDLLHSWLEVHKGTDYESRASTQVLNYLGALKRGGFATDEYAVHAIPKNHTHRSWMFMNVQWWVTK